MGDTYLTVVILEEDSVSMTEVIVDPRGAIHPTTACSSFDPREILDTEDPDMLFDELSRRLDRHWNDSSVINVRGSLENDKRVVISLPGTLTEGTRIISASRLKIRNEFNAVSFLNERGIEARLVHDVEAIAWGEYFYDDGDTTKPEASTSFALLLVDEGVGSKFIINGQTYNGAGVAGTISRLVVQPEGAFFPKLQARGNLEVFASRSWISRMIVENFHSLSEKSTPTTRPDSQEFGDIERRLTSLTRDQSRWGDLTFSDIGRGATANHPCFIKAIDTATKYMGSTIHSIMTIMNPNEIVIGGAAIDAIPGFYDKMLATARDLCWKNCWNSTQIRATSDVRTSQIIGATMLYMGTV